MSSKKRKFDIAVGRFISDPNAENAQGVQSEQDTQQEPKPTHIRGQKLPRINMAFTHENLDYLRSVSKLKGTSITQYVNDLVYADKVSKGDKLGEIQELIEDILGEV